MTGAGHARTDPAEPTRSAFAYPDAAGYPDGKGTRSQDQAILIDEVIADPHAPAFDYSIVNDEKSGIDEAIVGDTASAGLSYNVAGVDRLVLLATSVFPEFRNQGIAPERIRRVLDDVRTHGKTVTIMCPIVRTSIGRNPEYADLLDPNQPGVTKGPHLASINPPGSPDSKQGAEEQPSRKPG